MWDAVSIDVETGGPRGHPIIAIGLAAVSGSNVIPLLETLVRPRQARIQLTRVHGIRAEQLATATHFDAVWPVLTKHFENARWVIAHNAAFERRAIRLALADSGIPPYRLRMRCTLRLARRRWPGLKNDLVAVCERLGISHPLHHNALADAVAAAHVYRALLTDFPGT